MKMLQTASGYLQKYCLKDFTNHRKKTNRAVDFSNKPLLNILNYMDHKSNFRTV